MGRACAVLCLLLGLAGSLQAQVVINEFMALPVTGMPEWVELLNASTDSVDLRDWVLHDASTARPHISTGALVMAPGATVVLAKKQGLEGWFPSAVACQSVMVQLPSLNNSGDDLVLQRPDGTVADSVPYRTSWSFSTGRSLERIDPFVTGAMRENWAPCAAPARATPCGYNSVAPVLRDAVMRPPRFPDGPPRTGEQLRITTTVVNGGLMPLQSLTVSVFDDTDGDGDGSSGERVFTQQISDLKPGDSSRIDWTLQPTGSFLRSLIFLVEASGDERPWNDMHTDTVRYALPAGRVVLNEIMYAPQGGGPEWIELLNLSDDEALLSGWRIGDNASFRDIPTASIPAHGFLVLSASSSILDAHPGIAPSVLVMSLPSLNNDGDQVRLRTSSGETADSVAYAIEWGGADGSTLERINPAKPGYLRSNWCASALPDGTPARENSMAVRRRDLAVISALQSGTDVRVLVRNNGLQAFGCESVTMFADEDGDKLPDATERRASSRVPVIDPDDSSDVVFSGIARTPGVAHWIVISDCSDDERHANDTLWFATKVCFPPSSLIVNEIMYAPFPGEAEWVELYNAGDAALPLDGVMIAVGMRQGAMRSVHTLREGSGLLPRNGYAVVASDSTVFTRFPELHATGDSVRVCVLGRPLSLNNDGDAVAIIDPCGATTDSVAYAPAWHHPEVVSTTGRSLERLHPGFPSCAAGSWSSCPDIRGGTPGRRNAMYADPGVIPDAALSFSPNPFSPDGDGHEDMCVIGYRLPSVGALIRARVFDTQGRTVRTLAPGVIAGREGRLIFDGLDDQRRRLGIGMYVVLVEAVSSAGESLAALKGVVVVAARL